MLKPNSELRQEACNALSGNWLLAALAMLICMAIAAICAYIPIIGSLLCIFVGLPISWGIYILFQDIYYRKPFNGSTMISNMFRGFNDYGRIFGTMFLVQLYTFLWTLLLIVPGIIKACSYAMTPFILREHPELSYNAAIEKSMAMMEGHKMKYFLLTLSFIGWALLCVLTLGIGYLFLYPYVYTSYAAFYEDLKKESYAAATEGAVQG